MTPVSYISGYAMPGGKINWTRTIIMVLVAAFILWLVWKMVSPILDFFGGEKDSGEVNVDAEKVVAEMRLKGLQVDSDFNVQYWTNEFKRVIDKTVWTAVDSDRCNVFNKANDLSDAELTAVAITFKLAKKKSLRESIMALWTNGCWFEHPEEQLIERLERLDATSVA